MESFYEEQYRKMVTENNKIKVEASLLRAEIRKLKTEASLADLRSKSDLPQKKSQESYFKKLNTEKDKIIKELKTLITDLKYSTDDYKQKFSSTLDMLQKCNDNQVLSKKELKNLKNKMQDLLEDNDDQKIQIEKLKKYASLKIKEIREIQKKLKKDDINDNKKNQKKQEDEEKKRQREEEKIRKQQQYEAEQEKKRFREEQKKREEERKRQEQKAKDDLKRKQKEAVNDYHKKKAKEDKDIQERLEKKTSLEKQIKSIHGNLSIFSINMFFNLGIDFKNLDLKKWRKLTLKYHPDRVMNKSLNEQVKHEIIFNALNDYKSKIGGAKNCKSKKSKSKK